MSNSTAHNYENRDEFIKYELPHNTLDDSFDPEEAMLRDICDDFGVDYKKVEKLADIQASYIGRSYKSGINEAFDRVIGCKRKK